MNRDDEDSSLPLNKGKAENDPIGCGTKRGSLAEVLEQLGSVLEGVTNANERLAATCREVADQVTSEELRAYLLDLEKRVLRDEQEFQDVWSGKIICPRCGSRDQLLIIYGNSKIDRPDRVLHVPRQRREDDPRWTCNDCGLKWRRE